MGNDNSIYYLRNLFMSPDQKLEERFPMFGLKTTVNGSGGLASISFCM